LLSLHVGRLKDAGTVGHQHISMAKRNNVWMALETARLARDILGANGVTEDYPIMRHMMNLESVKTRIRGHARHSCTLMFAGLPAYCLPGRCRPYYVAYPAPLAGNQPSTVAANPHPLAARTTRDAIGSILPADSSSRTAPAFESAPVSGPAESPAETPGVDAVTIVFRDGRPRQQIRNYILTRKTLFIGDDDQPSIPVEQLDLTATIKANEEAGVIFQVPPAIQ
jgi:hypothetical protein